MLTTAYSLPEWQAVKLTFVAPCCNTESVFRLTVWLHEGPSIFNFALIFFKSGTHDFFFARCVPGLTIMILCVTKSLHVSNYSNCKHNAVSAPCFYDGLEVKTSQVLLSGSCPSTVWNIYPNVSLFANPGTCKSRRCFPTIIQVSVNNVCIEQQEFDIELLSNSKCTCCTLWF